MPGLHSSTHTLSATHIHDYKPQQAAVTFSDRRVLHYACRPDGGPIRHVLNPAEPHRRRPVHVEPREGEPPVPLTCPDGDLASSLLKAVDHLVADLYRWQAHRHNAPLRRYAVLHRARERSRPPSARHHGARRLPPARGRCRAMPIPGDRRTHRRGLARPPRRRPPCQRPHGLKRSGLARVRGRDEHPRPAPIGTASG